MESYRVTRPGRLFGQKEISTDEAASRLEGNDVVTIERTLEVSFKSEKRLSRKEAQSLKTQADLNAYLQRYAVEGAPRDVYRVEALGRAGWVAPESYAQAAFLDGNADFLITEGEILAETTPSKLSYERSGLLDFQYHSLTKEIPTQVAEYRSHAEMNAQMRDLAAKYPGLVEVVTLGQSKQGRPILGMKIGHGATETLLTGLTHAREWVSGEVPLQMAEMALESSRTSLLQDLTLWVVPVVNPDGYEISRTTDPAQRSNAALVDLNRNYPTEWRLAGDTPQSTRDDKGASDKPGSPTYRGQSALSEPETQAIDALLKSRPNLKGWLDFHGYGRLLLYPDSQRSKVYQGMLNAMQGQLEAPYTIEGLNQYGDVTGSALQHGEAQGILTVTMEIGQSFQPSGEAHQQTIREGVRAGMEFLRQMASQERSL